MCVCIKREKNVLETEYAASIKEKDAAMGAGTRGMRTRHENTARSRRMEKKDVREEQKRNGKNTVKKDA